jgi:arabinan endo-1,5-alpha-L-arabinosidase
MYSIYRETLPALMIPRSGRMGTLTMSLPPGRSRLISPGLRFCQLDATAAPAAAPVRGQFPIRCSTDLESWKFCGQVFPDIPQWIRESSPKTRDLWAPDVSFYDGLYHLYYSYSIFGKNSSGIALATNVTLDPASPKSRWVDQGLVLKSTEQDDFNAIDPNLVIDAKGNTWLAFGSFWSGIKMRRLDRKTGKLSTRDTKTYSLATRARPQDAAPAPPGLPANWEAIEAPFIIRHGNYYYLFVSWDLCCRGTKSTYRTMVGRSRRVTGPYVDKTGKPMMEGGGSELLVANRQWVGPGGESVLQLPGRDVIVFHAYAAHTGRPSLQISTLGWRDGWPSASLEGDANENGQQSMQGAPSAE